MTVSPSAALLVLCSINGALFALIAAILATAAGCPLQQILAASLITFCVITAGTIATVSIFIDPETPRP